MTNDKTLMTSRIVLKALFPVMKVVVADDPAMKKRFESVSARVQFRARHKGEDIGAALVFKDGELDIEQGVTGAADLTFSFKTADKFNDFLAGKPVIPFIRGWTKPLLLIKIVTLLLAMKILMPDARPADESKKRLKVKMVIYMITTALSQFNKGGNPDMNKWTGKQPDRIYQMSVGSEDIAAYLRVKAGKTKAGRGIYTRRRPFVHMKFNSIDGALSIFHGETQFVEALAKNHVTVEGSPEYAANMNDFMQRIQAMIV